MRVTRAQRSAPRRIHRGGAASSTAPSSTPSPPATRPRRGAAPSSTCAAATGGMRSGAARAVAAHHPRRRRPTMKHPDHRRRRLRRLPPRARPARRAASSAAGRSSAWCWPTRSRRAAELTSDTRVEARVGPLLGQCEALGKEGFDGVFHLASAVSGECEADFDLGLRSNLDTTRALLDALRAATVQRPASRRGWCSPARSRCSGPIRRSRCPTSSPTTPCPRRRPPTARTSWSAST